MIFKEKEKETVAALKKKKDQMNLAVEYLSTTTTLHRYVDEWEYTCTWQGPCLPVDPGGRASIA